MYEWTKKSLKFAQTKSGVKIGTQSFNLGLNEIMKWSVEDRPQKQAPPPPPQYQPQPQYQQPQQLVLPQHMQRQPPPPPPQQLYEQTDMGRPIPADQEMQRGMQQGTYAATSTQAHPGQDPNEAYRVLQQQPKTSLSGLRYGQRMEICDPPSELRQDVSRFSLTVGKQYRILEERLAQNGTDYLYKIIDDTGRERLVGWHYFRQQQQVRQEESYYDNRTGQLVSVARYVDAPGQSSQNYENRPRLLYENSAEPPMYRNVANTSSDQGMNGMMSKMDAAVRRRVGR